MTNKMSSISAFLKRFLAASSIGSANSHSPLDGLLPVISTHSLPVAFRVLMTPSIESAEPPIRVWSSRF